MNIEEKLRIMKKSIESVKTEKAKLEGSLETTMEQLKKDYGVTTIKAAEKHLDELRAEEDALVKEMNESVEALGKEYDWNES